MGGSRTKKGTRSGKKQYKKTDNPSAYIDGKFKAQNFNIKKAYDIAFKKNPNECEVMFGIQDEAEKGIDEDKHTMIINEMADSFQSGDYNKMRGLCGNECKIELRESPVGGRGIFATQPITKGEVVTMYPCHYLRKNFNKDGSKCAMCNMITGEGINDAKTGNDIQTRLVDYKQMMNKRTMITYGDPEITDEWSLLGHMFNDLSYNGTLDYDFSKASVVHTKGEFMVAIKDIQVGEELSYPYGLNYWFESCEDYPVARHKFE